MTMSDRHAGGSLWLDSLLYDESVTTGMNSHDLCDLVHEEFLRLGFAAADAPGLGEQPFLQPPSTWAMSSTESSSVPDDPHWAHAPSR
jgi:hypothetical protein